MTLATTDVFILCGGLGTRLATVIGHATPKCLTPVNGVPLAEHLIAYLRAQGARRFVMCAGHLAETVKAWAKGQKNVVVSIEKQKLGTGGALVSAFPLARTEDILVINADTMITADLKPMLVTHRTSGAPCTYLWIRKFGAPRRADAGYRFVSAAGRAALAAEVEQSPSYTFEDFAEHFGVKSAQPGMFLDIGGPVSFKHAKKFITYVEFAAQRWAA